MFISDDRQTDPIVRDGSSSARLVWFSVASAAATTHTADGGYGPRTRIHGGTRGYEQPPAGNAESQRNANTTTFNGPPD